MIIVGIDPGFTGGVAFYDPVSKKLVGLMPIPTTKSNGASAAAQKTSSAEFRSLIGVKEPRAEIDAATLAKAIFSAQVSFAVVEKVSASPQMGVTSAFRFGEGYGVLLGVLAAMGIPVKHVVPSVWKGTLGLSSDKTQSTKLAIELFPEYESVFTKSKKSADLAEAALLAHYGTRFIPTAPNS